MKEQENKGKRSEIAGFLRDKRFRLADQGKGKDTRDGCTGFVRQGC